MGRTAGEEAELARRVPLPVYDDLLSIYKRLTPKELMNYESRPNCYTPSFSLDNLT